MKSHRSLLFMLLVIVFGGLVACAGGEEAAAPEAETAPSEAEQVAASDAEPTIASEGLDTARFSTVLPEGWEVMADDLDAMGMMTLARKGTSGAEGVYFKFEGNGNWTDTAENAVASFATSQEGSEPAVLTANGIDWVFTSYRAYGTDQTMMVTGHEGTKVTVTVMGPAYDASPAVQAILNSLVLK